jgi:uncharacterized protein
MPVRAAFFDTSAIVPLCVAQPSSQRARQAYRGFSRQVVAWSTVIEATGAIYKATRVSGLKATNAKRALDRLVQLEKRWAEIVTGDRVRDIALDVLRNYDLRSGDAIQLASALVWCREKARHRSFVCFDNMLGAAARSIGFDVFEVSE